MGGGGSSNYVNGFKESLKTQKINVATKRKVTETISIWYKCSPSSYIIFFPKYVIYFSYVKNKFEEKKQKEMYWKFTY